MSAAVKPIEYNLKEKYDVIVVGSGASGGWAAKELSEQGLEVLLLEAGRTIQPQRDFPNKKKWISSSNPWPRLKAAILGQHIQARCESWNPQTKHFFVNDRENPYSVAKGSRFHWFRGRQEGGRLHAWGRIAPRMSDIDFAAVNVDGYNRKWPISYEDLVPYYNRVEKFLGIYSSVDEIDGLPDEKYMAPWPLTALETSFKEVIERNWPNRKITSARIMRQTSRVPATLLAAKKSGHCDIRPNAIVKNIEIDSHSGKSSGVCFLDRGSKKSYKVRSRAVVLCASTMESIRILLNSGCSRYPNGLCNSSGLLGRGIMDNTFVYHRGKTQDFDPLPPGSDRYDPSKGVGFFIPQFRNVEKQDAKFIRGYTLCGAIGRGGKYWWINSFGSMLPYQANRVTINKYQKDAWGIPTIHINCQFRENEWAMLADQKKSINEMIRAADLKESEAGGNWQERVLIKQLLKRITHEDSIFYPGAAIHECGGAAMGSDPTNSVTNSFNQCWDVSNIFITDGSCFVTSPAVNLTNSIMALTIRACDHIVRLFKSGDL